MKIKFILSSIIASLVLCSCNGNDEFTITVASGQYISNKCPIENAYVGETVFYLYKKDGSDKWNLNYFGIKNFTFERGYEVTMLVEELDATPVEDGPSTILSLKKIISKEQKESEVSSGVKEVVWNPEEEKYNYNE